MIIIILILNSCNHSRLIFIRWVKLVPQKFLMEHFLLDKYFFLIPSWFLSFLGLLDDLFNLSSKLKLFLELVFIFLFSIFLPFPISIFGVTIPDLFYLDKILLTLFIVFIINLINFMDGLDLYLGTTFILFILILFHFVVRNK